MNITNITDQEFLYLLEMSKRFTKAPKLPRQNTKASYLLIGEDSQDRFELNIERKNKIELHKAKFHHSYFKIPIIRLEIDSPDHRNPDGVMIGRNHIHIYKEGQGLMWAYELSSLQLELFQNHNNFLKLFSEFCQYCHIEYEDIDLQGVI